MNKNIAAMVFLAVCIVLALLLLSGTISPLVSGAVFAVALVVLGFLSGGFRHQRGG